MLELVIYQKAELPEAAGYERNIILSVEMFRCEKYK